MPRTPDEGHVHRRRGDWYLDDEHLQERRRRCWAFVAEFNALPVDAAPATRTLLEGLLGALGADALVPPPFRCTYGTATRIGTGAFLNHGVTILDDAPVTIGPHARLGTGVQLVTSIHPVDDHERRREGWEGAAPVVVGDNAWIGSGAAVCPGVRIGADVVVGAGSVVTRDVEPRTVVAGNPARLLRAT